MEPVDSDILRSFLTRLGERQVEPERLVLLGGSALVLLGAPRTTLDIDYVGDDLQPTDFQQTIHQLAEELDVHADPVPIASFVPLPAASEPSDIFVARFGSLEVFVLDPYAIALSKLDRGLDSDLADIVFLVRRGLVVMDQMERVLATALPLAIQYDMDPSAMRRHLAVVRQRLDMLRNT